MRDAFVLLGVLLGALAVLFVPATRKAGAVALEGGQVGKGAVAPPPQEAVPLDSIPKAVMDALLAKFPKAKIDKCTKAKLGDTVFYDIEFKQEGRKCEADIMENGTYINYEKAIDAKDLPKAVRDAIETRYPKAILKEVMEETAVTGKNEKVSAYEVVLDAGGNADIEVRVSPEGKILEDSATEKK